MKICMEKDSSKTELKRMVFFMLLPANKLMVKLEIKWKKSISRQMVNVHLFHFCLYKTEYLSFRPFHELLC